MVDIALLLLISGAVCLGCLHSWRSLQRVQQARHDDLAARERAIAQCRGGLPLRGDSPRRSIIRVPEAEQANWS